MNDCSTVPKESSRRKGCYYEKNIQYRRRLCKLCRKEEEAAQKTDGVREAVVSFMTQKMKVEFDDGADEAAVMKKVLKNCKRVEDDCEIYI